MVPREMELKLKPYYRTILPDVTNIVFIPTMLCNYRCPYCNILTKARYDKKYPKGVQHEWTEWVKVFDRFPSAIISITGGEPFLYPGLVHLIKNISQRHIIASLTTNLSLPFDTLLDIPDKGFNITASFHHYMTDRESFKAKIEKLRKCGFKVTVNFVAYPKVMHIIPQLKVYFEEKVHVPFNVDPYIDPSYKYTQKEAEIVRKYVADDRRKLGYSLNDYKPKRCKAGSKYFIILPNGDVYACLAGFYYSTGFYEKFNLEKEEFCLGNLFNNTFEPLSVWKICALPCCEGCDIEAADVKTLQRHTS